LFFFSWIDQIKVAFFPTGQSFRESWPEFGRPGELREPFSQLPEEPEGPEDVGQGATPATAG